MPGLVSAANPTTVMPLSFSVAFVRSQEYPVRATVYPDGTYQATVQATTSRKRWRLVKRLSASAVQDLRNFYDARKGKVEEFYFYDPYETNPKFSYDATGVATVGRYTVRFDMPWSQGVGIRRSEVEVQLVEVA